MNRIIKRNAIQEDLKSPDYKIRTFFIIGGFNVKFCFLTDKFFDLYKECEEIEKKNNRPYATICLLKYNNLYFAIPIRHNIKHQYAIFTDKEKTKGLDLSKTLIIKDLNFVVQNRTAFISQNEYNQLIQKETFIISKLNSYIKKYIKALKHQNIKKNYLLCSMSCLKYFHKELNIE